VFRFMMCPVHSQVQVCHCSLAAAVSSKMMCRRLWDTSRPHLTVPGVQEGQREACGVRQSVVSQQQAEGCCRIGPAARHALPRLRMRLCAAPASSD
jgi:hypothetical protein